jgi:hypothetical protein
VACVATAGHTARSPGAGVDLHGGVARNATRFASEWERPRSERSAEPHCSSRCGAVLWLLGRRGTRVGHADPSADLLLCTRSAGDPRHVWWPWRRPMSPGGCRRGGRRGARGLAWVSAINLGPTWWLPPDPCPSVVADTGRWRLTVQPRPRGGGGKRAAASRRPRLDHQVWAAAGYRLPDWPVFVDPGSSCTPRRSGNDHIDVSTGGTGGRRSWIGGTSTSWPSARSERRADQRSRWTRRAVPDDDDGLSAGVGGRRVLGDRHTGGAGGPAPTAWRGGPRRGGCPRACCDGGGGTVRPRAHPGGRAISRAASPSAATTRTSRSDSEPVLHVAPASIRRRSGRPAGPVRQHHLGIGGPAGDGGIGSMFLST